MELTLQEAEARLKDLVTAAQNGERVVITTNGEPAVELLRCNEREVLGLEEIDFTHSGAWTHGTGPA